MALLFPPPTVTDKAHWPPDYTAVFGWRQQQLEILQEKPELIPGMLEYYRTRPIEFICHWCDTYDPRLAMHDLPTRLPLILFPKQAELVQFVISCLEDQARGLIDKSRDMGATWVLVAISVWLWFFRPGASIGWGSRKEHLVDKIGDPDSIFQKMRMVIRGLPRIFWPKGFNPDRHMSFMRFVNPENGATITGEAGDNIGRGGRKLIQVVDEAAHLEHPESIEAALTDNTNVQIDISTVNGVGTVFDRKREAGIEWHPGIEIPKGKTRVLVMDWSDHPAKDLEWYRLREQKAIDDGLLHLFRQEVDRNPAASLVGTIIPPEWVTAAIDAHITLGFGDEGGWGAALDVADGGYDLNALTFRKGVVLNFAMDWGDVDTGSVARRAIQEATERRPLTIYYDCIGVGAGVKAEVNRIRDETDSTGKSLLPKDLFFMPWNAGAGVLYPEKRVIAGDSQSPYNKDFYGNLKAQGWWALRRRFEKTYRAVTQKLVCDPSEMISLDSTLPRLAQIKRELSQPTAKKDGRLRLIVDKTPEGTRSPNLADSIMMNYFPLHLPMNIDPAVLQAMALGGRRR